VQFDTKQDNHELNIDCEKSRSDRSPNLTTNAENTKRSERRPNSYTSELFKELF